MPAHRSSKMQQSASLLRFESKRVELHAEPAGKEPCDWISDGKADLFTAAEAIHWFDRQACLSKQLRNSDLAEPCIWFYPTKPLIYIIHKLRSMGQTAYLL
ncbi:hypothetical protein U1Q18_052172 [Sarracenia purpurea var. burkii]